MNDTTLFDVLERMRNRFYGKYRGTVTQVDDQTLRIRAKIPMVLGDQESGWCLPCVPYAGPQVGIAFLPEVGSAVWIEFEGGDVSYPVWTGCFWNEGEIPSDAKPKVKVIVTAAPHKIVLDDDQKSITVSDANGNSIVLDSSGIAIKKGSQTIQVSDGSVSVNNGALEVT